MKNILIAIVSALLIICFCTACYSDSIVASDSVADDLPSKVDLRNYDGKNYVTSVKRQSFGDCWSFSLAGSAEIAYLYANNMGVDAGELNDYVDFSEKYIAWYMYHGMTNEDVVKGKVRASQTGEGFDPKEAEASNKNVVFEIGGEFVHYGNLFGSGFGPVDEKTSVNGEYPYDDDYPKENFVERDESGKITKGSLPPRNGALIIKNSWGTVDSEEDGFFYLSYYDHSICSPMSYEFDNNKDVKHTDINYDQYDLMMTEWYGNSDYMEETKMANIFVSEEDESLFQISYITSLPDTEVEYEIYTGVDDTPFSGRLLEKGEIRHTFAGYHKIDLKGEYPLKKGERYSVVLTMKRSGDDGSVVYTETFPYSTKFSTGLNVKGIVNRGESYLYHDGKWTDMSEMKDSLIERAYSQLNEKLGSKETFTSISLDSKDTFTIDNYLINTKITISPLGISLSGECDQKYDKQMQPWGSRCFEVPDTDGNSKVIMDDGNVYYILINEGGERRTDDSGVFHETTHLQYSATKKMAWNLGSNRIIIDLDKVQSVIINGDTLYQK